MSNNGRITYNSINIDLARGWSGFPLSKNESRIVQRSEAGLTEYLNFYNQDIFTVIRNLLTAQEFIAFLQFYAYAKDGTSFIVLRDRDLGGYWGFEKTLNNNDEVSCTFTRTAGTASNASYIDPSTGLLTWEDTVDTPRYPAGKYGHGVLAEGARTNICQESEDFTGAGWGVTNMTRADDTAETLDPAGGNNAAKLTASAANGIIAYTTAVAQGGDDGVFSVYVKCATGTVEGEIQIGDDFPRTNTTQAFTATPTWQRIQVVAENVSGTNWEVRVQIDTNTEIIYAYGAELNVGANALFASNYIQTDGGTKARNAELNLCAAANILLQGQNTVGFWFKPEWAYDIGTIRMFFVSGADDSNRYISIGINASDNWEVRAYYSNGTSSMAVGPSASDIAIDTWIHVVVTVDPTVSNGVKLYLNGALKLASTSDPFDISAVGTNLAFGSFLAGGSEAFGIIDDPFIRNDVLSAAEINKIYNHGMGIGENRNRWAAVALSDPAFNPIRRIGTNRYDLQLSLEEVLS